jgi:dolichol-phosphate mannosyltransferase
VILVDDGSEDRTAEIVEGYDGPVPVELVRLDRNRGPGAAFRAGFDAALADIPDDGLVVTLEGDTTSDLDALPEMLERAAAGADLVVASWRMVNVNRRRRILSAGAGFMVRHALGLDAHTVSSFFRVYRVSALRAANDRYGPALIEEDGFACAAEVLAKLARMGLEIDEVPVCLDWTRRAGKSKMPVAATVLGYWRMLLRARAAGEPARG